MPDRADQDPAGDGRLDPRPARPGRAGAMLDSQAPFFEDLEVGIVDRSAPAVTLTEGIAAVHQAILGDRLALALDRTLAGEVLGAQAPLAHPGLVWDIAIGQSTTVTRRVIANLFYRGLVLRRAPLIGDTLASSTKVVALRETTRRPGRPATGLAVLRIRTTDQQDRPVLDFWRCAMLPLRDPDGRTGREDSFDSFPAELDERALLATTAGWDLGALAAARLGGGQRALGGVRLREMPLEERIALHGGDVVSSAPELARLSLNLAAVHHDAGISGRRLVYGGHTIGLAAAQAARALPEIATILAWHSCEHLGPVHEGDTLHSDLELERLQELPGGGALAHLRSRVHAQREQERAAVLDWRFVALAA